MMEKFDIQASFKRINSKFADDLTEEDKIKAIKQFRKLYAEEMSKLALQIERKQKVQDNLNTINLKEKSGAREIDDSLRKRMEQHDKNREKRQESKQKEFKMMEENWRNRYQQILRKNKAKQRDAYEKAEQMRKDVEIYWKKKSEALQLRDQSQDRRGETVKPSYSNSRAEYKPRNAQTYYNLYQPSNKVKVNFPQLSKRSDLDNSKYLNRSIGESTINDEIRTHQEKSIKEGKEAEEEKIRNLMERLEKIERTRKVAKEQKEKQITKAKKEREYRENPEVLEANRRKSIAQFRKQRLPRKSEGSRHDLSYSPSKSKMNLNDSIIRHLQSKKRLKEVEFFEREHAYEQKKNKIKQTQINRMVRDTINMLKHQALSDVRE